MRPADSLRGSSPKLTPTDFRHPSDRHPAYCRPLFFSALSHIDVQLAQVQVQVQPYRPERAAFVGGRGSYIANLDRKQSGLNMGVLGG